MLHCVECSKMVGTAEKHDGTHLLIEMDEYFEHLISSNKERMEKAEKSQRMLENDKAELEEIKTVLGLKKKKLIPAVQALAVLEVEVGKNEAAIKDAEVKINKCKAILMSPDAGLQLPKELEISPDECALNVVSIKNKLEQVSADLNMHCLGEAIVVNIFVERERKKLARLTQEYGKTKNDLVAAQRELHDNDVMRKQVEKDQESKAGIHDEICGILKNMSTDIVNKLHKEPAIGHEDVYNIKTLFDGVQKTIGEQLHLVTAQLAANTDARKEEGKKSEMLSRELEEMKRAIKTNDSQVSGLQRQINAVLEKAQRDGIHSLNGDPSNRSPGEGKSTPSDKASPGAMVKNNVAAKQDRNEVKKSMIGEAPMPRSEEEKKASRKPGVVTKTSKDLGEECSANVPNASTQDAGKGGPRIKTGGVAFKAAAINTAQINAENARKAKEENDKIIKAENAKLLASRPVTANYSRPQPPPRVTHNPVIPSRKPY